MTCVMSQQQMQFQKIKYRTTWLDYGSSKPKKVWFPTYQNLALNYLR